MIGNKELINEYDLFSKNIKYYRKRLKLTQECLAERADISTSYLKQIESGREYKNVSLTTLLKLAKALNTTIKNLFDEEKEM